MKLVDWWAIYMVYRHHKSFFFFIIQFICCWLFSLTRIIYPEAWRCRYYCVFYYHNIWEIANYRTICYFRNLTIIKINCRELLHQHIYYIFIIMYLLGAKCRFIDLTEASTKFDHNLSSKNLCLINCAITTSNKISGKEMNLSALSHFKH